MPEKVLPPPTCRLRSYEIYTRIPDMYPAGHIRLRLWRKNWRWLSIQLHNRPRTVWLTHVANSSDVNLIKPLWTWFVYYEIVSNGSDNGIAQSHRDIRADLKRYGDVDMKSFSMLTQVLIITLIISAQHFIGGRRFCWFLMQHLLISIRILSHEYSQRQPDEQDVFQNDFDE